MFGKSKDELKSEDLVSNDDVIDVVDDVVSEVVDKSSDESAIVVDGDGLVTIEVKKYMGPAKIGGTWYDLKNGRHKVPKNVRDVLKVRGDLG